MANPSPRDASRWVSYASCWVSYASRWVSYASCWVSEPFGYQYVGIGNVKCLCLGYSPTRPQREQIRVAVEYRR